MTPQLESKIFARRTVCERHVVVGDIVEEMDLVFGQQKARGNRMDRRVPPSFIEESTVLVETLEKVNVRL